MLSRNRVLSRRKAFLFLLVLGLLAWSFKLFKTYLVFKGYKDPPPLVPYPSLFQYTAYALVAFVFPYSWNQFTEFKKRAVLVGFWALLFSVIYIFILNLLEWTFRFNDYDLLGGFIFSLYHTGLIVLLSYSVIAVLLQLLGVTNGAVLERAEYLERLTYKVKNETFIVDVRDVVYFQSNDNYTSIHFQDDSYQLIRKPISELEKQLDSSMFQRIHRKSIVNCRKISSLKVNDSGGTEIEVSNGQKLNVSKTYRSKLKVSL